MLFPDVFAGSPYQLVVRKGVTAIQPIKSFGDTSVRRVRQVRVSGRSQGVIYQE